MKKRNKQEDYIKANRKGSREAEIALYGRPVNQGRVHQSKKVYNRKRDKAGREDLLFLFLPDLLLSAPDSFGKRQYLHKMKQK